MGIVAHTYNPSYSRGGNQEGCGSKPVQGKSYQDPHLNKPGMVRSHACDPSYVGDHKKEDSHLRPAPGKNTRPYLKKNNLKAKRSTGVVQVIEYLPSKYKALSSNSSTARNK
jgi:hypothetical protein